MAMTQEQLEQVLAAPALPPPNGTTPQFDNPPNGNTLAWAVTTFCTVVLTLCFLLRLYGKVWVERKFNIEEVLVICAYGAYWGTAYAAYSLIWTPGYYVHTWNLHNGDLVKPLWLILIYGCCYSAVLPCLKTAILIDWTRFFVPGRKTKSPFWWACMFVVFIQCTWGVACIILLNLQCRPHRAIWEFWLPSKCYNLPKVMLGSASIQVISDIAMVLMPQHIIWGLKMTWQRKIGIALIFGVGILACVAACFRLAHTVTFSKESDSMWYIGPLLFWACGEMTCGFFILSVTCIPKIIVESGLSARVKRAIGISVKSSNMPKSDSNYPSYPNTKELSKSGNSTDNYYKLDEDGVPMTVFDRSESQEHLREEEHRQTKTGEVHVTRTTTVTRGRNSSGEIVIPNLTPWTDQTHRKVDVEVD